MFFILVIKSSLFKKVESILNVVMLGNGSVSVSGLLFGLKDYTFILDV